MDKKFYSNNSNLFINSFYTFKIWMMNVLVGFEESQAVTIEMRKKGHKAFSCDIQECSGGHSEWHLKMDIFNAIKLQKWDLIILHPPCTYTALCGNRWYYNNPLRKEGIKLCSNAWVLATSLCNKVALEQPKTIMQKYIGEKSQVIHPWQFGHKECKETWLWLHNLPKLSHTNIVGPPPSDLEERKSWEKVFRMAKSDDRGKLRSKTYSGIAKAMADQWA